MIHKKPFYKINNYIHNISLPFNQLKYQYESTLCNVLFALQPILYYYLFRFKSVQYLNNYIMYKLLFYGGKVANANIKTRYFEKLKDLTN